MKKYKSGLVTSFREKEREEQKQIDLKRKHGLDPEENIVVVEKNNLIKFLIKTVIKFVQLCMTIGLLILAAIGLMTLIYPEIRTVFLEVWNGLYNQFFSFL